MSLEFTVFMQPGKNACFPMIAEQVISHIPAVQRADDGCSFWLPGKYSHWIDFSIEICEEGFFIVTNMNGSSNKRLFQLIGAALEKLEISYFIDEV